MPSGDQLQPPPVKHNSYTASQSTQPPSMLLRQAGLREPDASAVHNIGAWETMSNFAETDPLPKVLPLGLLSLWRRWYCASRTAIAAAVRQLGRGYPLDPTSSTSSVPEWTTSDRDNPCVIRDQQQQQPPAGDMQYYASRPMDSLPFAYAYCRILYLLCLTVAWNVP